MNFYYLEESTLSNLNRIFLSGEIPFLRLSKFLEGDAVEVNPNQETKEKIGFYRRKVGPAVLDEVWKSPEFTDFLKKITGLNLEFRKSNNFSYSGGDYSLLHAEELEKKRVLVAYDFTKSWRYEWGGHDMYSSPGKDPLICSRDFGSLMIVKLEQGDLSCTRYTSLMAKSEVQLDQIIYDIK